MIEAAQQGVCPAGVCLSGQRLHRSPPHVRVPADGPRGFDGGQDHASGATFGTSGFGACMMASSASVTAGVCRPASARIAASCTNIWGSPRQASSASVTAGVSRPVSAFAAASRTSEIGSRGGPAARSGDPGVSRPASAWHSPPNVQVPMVEESQQPLGHRARASVS